MNSASSERIAAFRVELEGIQPLIWRRFAVRTANPPKDCKGIPGYYDFLKRLSGKSRGNAKRLSIGTGGHTIRMILTSSRSRRGWNNWYPTWPRTANPDEYEGEMSDCLHCDINDLVEKRLEREGADLGELAGRVAESLADLILLAPAEDQAKLIADVLGNFGQVFLEKSGAIEAGESSQRH